MTRGVMGRSTEIEACAGRCLMFSSYRSIPLSNDRSLNETRRWRWRALTSCQRLPGEADGMGDAQPLDVLLMNPLKFVSVSNKSELT